MEKEYGIWTLNEINSCRYLNYREKLPKASMIEKGRTQAVKVKLKI